MKTLAGKYLGKTLKKTGEKKNGETYTMYKATFEVNFDGNVKPVNFTVFDSCKGFSFIFFIFAIPITGKEVAIKSITTKITNIFAFILFPPSKSIL